MIPHHPSPTDPTPPQPHTHARRKIKNIYIYRGIFLARPNFTKRKIKQLNPGCEGKKDINGAPHTFKLGANHWGIILKEKEKEQKIPLPFYFSTAFWGKDGEGECGKRSARDQRRGRGDHNGSNFHPLPRNRCSNIYKSSRRICRKKNGRAVLSKDRRNRGLNRGDAGPRLVTVWIILVLVAGLIRSAVVAQFRILIISTCAMRRSGTADWGGI